MWEGYKPTKAEHKAIEKGMFALEHAFQNEWMRISKCIRDEHTGYGMSSQRIPLDGARGLICKWFADGVADRDMLLRDMYYVRPASTFMTGLGCAHSDADLLLMNAIWAATAAHEAAFKRMHDADLAAIRSHFAGEV